MSRMHWLLFVSGAIWGCGGDSGATEGESESEAEAESESESESESEPMPVDDKVIPPLDCSGGDCATIVMSRLLMPSTEQPYRCDVDDSGVEENALGAALGLIGMLASEGTDLQTQIDESTLAGGTVLVAAIQADDWANDPDAGIQFWQGEDADMDWTNNVVDKDGDDVPDAFVAGAAYAVAATSPLDLAMGGEISGGNGAFGPGRFILTLPLADFGTADLALYAVNVTGPLTGPPDTALGNDSASGVLCGGIPRDVFNEEIVPLIAGFATDACHDPKTGECIPDDSTCSTILSLFDTIDMDCTISNEEVQENSLLMTTLPDDLDLFIGPPEDRVRGTDGVNDSISLGLGIMGISASFEVPAPE